MTVRDRIFACRLIEKIEANKEYAEKIGVSYSYKTNSPREENSKEKETEKRS